MGETTAESAWETPVVAEETSLESSVTSPTRPAPVLPIVAASAAVVSTMFAISPAPLLVGTSGLAVTMLGASLFAWVWARGDSAPVDALRRPLLVSAGVLALVMFASALTAPLPLQALVYGAEGSAMGLPVWLALVGVLAVASGVVLGGRLQRGLAFAAVPIAVYPYLYALLGSLKGEGVFAALTPAPASISLAMLPIVLLEARRTRLLWGRAGWWLVALLIAWLGLSENTASSIGATLLVVALVLTLAPGLVFIPPGRVRTVVRSVVAVLLAGVVVLGVVAWSAPSAVPEPVAAVVADTVAGPTVGTRVQMWKAALAVLAERPLTGAGPDGLLVASQRYLPADLVREEGNAFFGVNILVHDPHLLPLRILSNGGILGGLAALALGVVWVWTVVRRVREDARTALVRTAYAIGFAGLLGTIVFMPWPNWLGVVPALLAGLAVAPSSAPAAAFRVPRSARAGAAVVVTLAALWLSATAVAGDVAIARAGDAVKSGDAAAYAVARDAAAIAARLQPGRPAAVFETLHAEGRGVADGSVPFERFRRAVEAAPPAVSDNGVYLALLAQQALDHARLRSDDAAAAWARGVVRRSADLTRNHPEVILEQAHAAIVLDRPAEAQRHLDEAAALGSARRRQTLYEYQLARLTGDTATAARRAALIRYRAPELARLLDP